MSNHKARKRETIRAEEELRCRLCGAANKLINSHIFPDFFIRSLERDIVTGTKGQPQPASIALSTRPEIKSGQRQRGFWEKKLGFKQMLLCAKCEEKFSVYESYFRKFFYGKDPSPLIKRDIGKVITQSGWPTVDFVREVREVLVDYPQLKLFVLSLLWRSGIAIGEFFRDVHLGAKHEERIRTLLLEADPAPDYHYAIVMADLRSGSSTLEDFIEQPTVGRDEGQRFYKLTLGGFMFLIYVTSADEKPPELISSFRLRECGRLTLGIVEATPFLKWWADRLAAAGVLKPK